MDRRKENEFIARILARDKDNQNKIYAGSKPVKQIKVDSAIAHGGD